RARVVDVLDRVRTGVPGRVRVVRVHHVGVRERQDVAVPVQHDRRTPLRAIGVHRLVDHVLGEVLQVGVDGQLHRTAGLGRGAGALPGRDDLTLGADLHAELTVGAQQPVVQAGLQTCCPVTLGVHPTEDLTGGVAVRVD